MAVSGTVHPKGAVSHDGNMKPSSKRAVSIRPTAKTIAAAHIKDYEKEYQKSIADPEAFWSGMAKELDWFSPWSTVLEWNYPWAKWFVGATCNITYNCLDRHVKTWRRIRLHSSGSAKTTVNGSLPTANSIARSIGAPTR